MSDLIYDTSELYNSEIKAHFLEDYDIQTNSKRAYFNNFKIASKIEKEKKKDLYEMTDDEVEEVLAISMKNSYFALSSMISNFRNYVNWCDGIYTERAIPLFAETSTRKLVEKYIAHSRLDFYTRDEVMDGLSKLDNPLDRFLILSVFEGIGGQKYSEIANMRLEHLKEIDGKYYVDLYDTERGIETLNHEISKELYETAIEAEETNIYHNYATGKPNELKKTGYIARRRITSNSSERLNVPQFFASFAIKHYKEVFESDVLKMGFFKQSGMMYYIYELIKNQEDNDKIITKEHLALLSDKFRFGTYMHSDTLETTYNYATIKNEINREFFEKNYCKFNYE